VTALHKNASVREARQEFDKRWFKPDLHGTICRARFVAYDKSYVLKTPTTSRREFEQVLERAQAILQIVPRKSGFRNNQ